MQPPKRRVLVYLVGGGILAVYLGAHDGVPGGGFGQVADQLVAHVGHGQRQRAGHNHGRRVVGHPQPVDDARHEAQDAAGALELFERGPVFVEAVEHLGVDGVARFHAAQVFQFARLGREVVRVRSVIVREGLAHAVACVGVHAVFEKPAAYHLEALVVGHGLPDGFHAAKGVLDRLEGHAASLAADFVVGLGDGGHHQAVLALGGRFGNLLYKGEQVAEGAGGQLVVVLLPELAGIGHQLVDEDQAWAAVVKQFSQRRGAGCHATPVGVTHVLVEFRTARRDGELGRNLTPQSAHLDAGQLRRTASRGGVGHDAHDGGHVHLGQLVDARLFEYGTQVLDFLDGGASAQQVVEGQHAVGLASAERRLELDDRFAALVAYALERLDEQSLHALGHVGAAEELHRVLVLEFGFVLGHLIEVGGELGLAVATLHHVAVGKHDVAPAG